MRKCRGGASNSVSHIPARMWSLVRRFRLALKRRVVPASNALDSVARVEGRRATERKLDIYRVMHQAYRPSPTASRAADKASWGVHLSRTLI
jgi:hypothetical protein